MAFEGSWQNAENGDATVVPLLLVDGPKVAREEVVLPTTAVFVGERHSVGRVPDDVGEGRIAAARNSPKATASAAPPNRSKTNARWPSVDGLMAGCTDRERAPGSGLLSSGVTQRLRPPSGDVYRQGHHEKGSILRPVDDDAEDLHRGLLGRSRPAAGP